MNNSKLLYVAATLLILLSCTRQPMPAPDAGTAGNNGAASQPGYGHFDWHTMAKQGYYFKPVTIDTANRMIMSYLNSINYGVNTEAPRSLIYDADTLRDYLNDTTKGKIRYVKFMFAHQLDYINSGHEGQRPDSNTNAITMIIVGYDQNNNYVLNRNNMVYDHFEPCPRNCPTYGTAAYNIIQ